METRTSQFLSCIGNAQSLPQIESDNQEIDNYLTKKEEPQNANST